MGTVAQQRARLGVRAVAPSQRGSGSCRVCGLPGHQAGFIQGSATYVDCPNLACYLCKLPGHTTATCSHRIVAEDADAQVAPNSTTGSGRALSRIELLRRRQMGFRGGSGGSLQEMLARRCNASAALAAHSTACSSSGAGGVDAARSCCGALTSPYTAGHWRVGAACYKLHSRRVTTLSFHPARQDLLVSADKGGEIGIWRFLDGAHGDCDAFANVPPCSRAVYAGHKWMVNAVDWYSPPSDGGVVTPSTSTLVSASSDGTVRLQYLERRTWEELADANPGGWTGDESKWRMFGAISAGCAVSPSVHGRSGWQGKGNCGVVRTYDDAVNGAGNTGDSVITASDDDEAEADWRALLPPKVLEQVQARDTNDARRRSKLASGCSSLRAGTPESSTSSGVASCLIWAGDDVGRLWGIDPRARRRVVACFQGHKRGTKVQSLQHHPLRPDTWLLSAGNDWTAKVWDLRALRASIPAPAAAATGSSSTAGVPGIAGFIHSFSGSAVVAGDLSTSVYNAVAADDSGVTFGPLSSGHASATTYAVDVSNLKPAAANPIVTLPHGRLVTNALFSPGTGSRLMTTCADNRIRVWDDVGALLALGYAAAKEAQSAAASAMSVARSAAKPKSAAARAAASGGTTSKPAQVVTSSEERARASKASMDPDAAPLSAVAAPAASRAQRVRGAGSADAASPPAPKRQRILKLPDSENGSLDGVPTTSAGDAEPEGSPRDVSRSLASSALRKAATAPPPLSMTSAAASATAADAHRTLMPATLASSLQPDVELVHSHDYGRYLTPFRAVWDAKDATEETLACGRYISEAFSKARLREAAAVGLTGNPNAGTGAAGSAASVGCGWLPGLRFLKPVAVDDEAEVQANSMALHPIDVFHVPRGRRRCRRPKWPAAPPVDGNSDSDEGAAGTAAGGATSGDFDGPGPCAAGTAGEEGATPAAQQPRFRVAAQLVDPLSDMISPLASPHHGLAIMATAASRNVYLWVPSAAFAHAAERLASDFGSAAAAAAAAEKKPDLLMRRVFSARNTVLQRGLPIRLLSAVDIAAADRCRDDHHDDAAAQFDIGEAIDSEGDGDDDNDDDDDAANRHPRSWNPRKLGAGPGLEHTRAQATRSFGDPSAGSAASPSARSARLAGARPGLSAVSGASALLGALPHSFMVSGPAAGLSTGDASAASAVPLDVGSSAHYDAASDIFAVDLPGGGSPGSAAASGSGPGRRLGARRSSQAVSASRSQVARRGMQASDSDTSDSDDLPGRGASGASGGGSKRPRSAGNAAAASRSGVRGAATKTAAGATSDAADANDAADASDNGPGSSFSSLSQFKKPAATTASRSGRAASRPRKASAAPAKVPWRETLAQSAVAPDAGSSSAAAPVGNVHAASVARFTSGGSSADGASAVGASALSGIATAAANGPDSNVLNASPLGQCPQQVSTAFGGAAADHSDASVSAAGSSSSARRTSAYFAQSRSAERAGVTTSGVAASSTASSSEADRTTAGASVAQSITEAACARDLPAPSSALASGDSESASPPPSSRRSSAYFNGPGLAASNAGAALPKGRGVRNVPVSSSSKVALVAASHAPALSQRPTQSRVTVLPGAACSDRWLQLLPVPTGSAAAPSAFAASLDSILAGPGDTGSDSDSVSDASGAGSVSAVQSGESAPSHSMSRPGTSTSSAGPRHDDTIAALPSMHLSAGAARSEPPAPVSVCGPGAQLAVPMGAASASAAGRILAQAAPTQAGVWSDQLPDVGGVGATGATRSHRATGPRHRRFGDDADDDE